MNSRLSADYERCRLLASVLATQKQDAHEPKIGTNFVPTLWRTKRSQHVDIQTPANKRAPKLSLSLSLVEVAMVTLCPDPLPPGRSAVPSFSGQSQAPRIFTFRAIIVMGTTHNENAPRQELISPVPPMYTQPGEKIASISQVNFPNTQ
jgi:hypothetical protein